MLYLPRELPDLRTRMAEYAASSDGADMISKLGGDWMPGADLDALIKSEHQAFTEAALLHLSPTMVDLLMQAKEGIGSAGFMDHDLPMPVGFAYFGQSVQSAETGGENLMRLLGELSEEEQAAARERWNDLDELHRVAELKWSENLAVLWRYVPPSEPFPHGHVVLSWYVERDSWWEWAVKLYSCLRSEESIERMRASLYKLSPLVYDGHILIGCSPDAADMSVLRYDAATRPEHWRARRADMFRALCYLLRQKHVVDTTVMHPDRPTRRRAAREGREAPDVRVLSLRGVGSGGGAGDGSREYLHQWIVRGHWRRQWYPSIQQHRPRWIAPHVKGPDGAPLLGGEKVYATRV